MREVIAYVRKRATAMGRDCADQRLAGVGDSDAIRILQMVLEPETTLPPQQKVPRCELGRAYRWLCGIRVEIVGMELKHHDAVTKELRLEGE